MSRLTTITQALAKILYLERFQPGLGAKLRQTVIAIFAFDSLVPKDTQLPLLLNIAGLGGEEGREIRGFADGEEAYFDKNFEELTTDEYLALVAMLIAPNGINVETDPTLNARRVEYIKRLLRGDYEPRGLMDLYYDKEISDSPISVDPSSGRAGGRAGEPANSAGKGNSPGNQTDDEEGQAATDTKQKQ